MNKTLVLDASFPARPFYQRFALAHAAGFRSVALDGWTELDFSRVNTLRTELDLAIAAISGSQGDTLADPAAAAAFLEHLAQSIAVARSFDCKNMVLSYANALARVTSPDPRPHAHTRASYATATLMDAAAAAAKAGMTLFLKPVGGADPLASARGLLSAADVVRRLSLPALRLYCDLGEVMGPVSVFARRLYPCRDVAGFVHVVVPGGGYSERAAAELLAALEGEVGYCGLVGFTIAGE